MIIIPNPPIPKKSVRHTRKGFAYNSQKKEMDALKLFLKGVWRLPPLEGAVELDVTFYMPIPKSATKRKRESLVDTHHIKRPDRDNLMKFICDCMSNIVYKDDSQVADGRTRKIYGSPPRTEINIIDISI